MGSLRKCRLVYYAGPGGIKGVPAVRTFTGGVVRPDHLQRGAHGSGSSVITVCVLTDGVSQGAEFRVDMSSLAYEVSTIGANGDACVEFTIYSYGTYSWTIKVTDGSTVLTRDRSMTVDSSNQNCTL